MNLEENSINNVKPDDLIFARHETFHPRFGWIKKGFDASLKDPNIFSQEDFHIQLGVGKNMGSSIKYWCLAFKVLSQLTHTKQTTTVPSNFGLKLLEEKTGYDPFLEDTASLWLLHWYLLKQPCYATAWSFLFNHFRQNEFSPEEILTALCNYRNKFSTRFSDSSLHKDVTCILRMYCESPSQREFDEESLDCPFVELGIIKKNSGAKSYAFRIGSKPTLPDEIIVFSCLEYACLLSNKQRTISLSRLLYDIGSPGLIFKLTESAICNAIEKVSQYIKHIILSDTAGIIQLAFTKEPEKLADTVLQHYYRRGTTQYD